MIDKYSFKEPENTNNLAKQMTKNAWKPIQKAIKQRKTKHQKIIKNSEKSTKITSRDASGTCKASKWAKMALNGVGSQILGVPWDPLGDPKIVKKSKK